MGYISLPCPQKGCDALLTWIYEVNAAGDGVYWHGRCDYCGYEPPDYTAPVIEIPEGLRYANETGQTGD